MSRGNLACAKSGNNPNPKYPKARTCRDQPATPETAKV
jgi:hypothetical protein